MDSDPDSVDDPRSAATEQPDEFGSNAYAARTFVALVSLGTDTARDVSRVSEVHDATDERRMRIQKETPGANRFGSPWIRSDASAGRPTRVDGTGPLVSVSVGGSNAARTYPRTKTGCLARG